MVRINFIFRKNMGYFIFALLMTIGLADMGNAEKPDNGIDLTALSLEELMNIEVTLVSRKAEKLSDAAAAVYVITNEDVAHMGATSLPNVLRLVPGMNVAQIDANKWGVTVRGFNNLFANMFLVLIDGRSVYSPVFSGVFWETQDILMADLDRIEVIRGPGATLWGSNAVNGIINIVTKSAKETRGGLVQAGGGTEERLFGSARYGGKIGSNLYYRFFVKYFDRGSYVDQENRDVSDAWSMKRGGFRMDWDAGASDQFVFKGDFFSGYAGNTMIVPYTDIRLLNYNAEITGGNLMARWFHKLSERSDYRLHAYLDHFTRKDQVQAGGSYTTVDVDFQHQFPVGLRHHVIWGAGFRNTSDSVDSTEYVYFSPSEDSYALWSAFLQDEMAFLNNRIHLTVGAKFEHNEFTQWEIQPNIRCDFKPDEGRIIWGSVTRAVRIPSRSERDMTNIIFSGSKDFVSETVIASELGYRCHPGRNMALDIAAFWNTYDRLRSLEKGRAGNLKQGVTRGVELAVDFMVMKKLTARMGYAFLDMDIALLPESEDLNGGYTEDESPAHQFQILTTIDLRQNLQLGLFARYVSGLHGFTVNVDPYLTLDSRLAWKPVSGLEISCVGQNLLQRAHYEYPLLKIPFLSSQLPRGVYSMISWRF